MEEAGLVDVSSLGKLESVKVANEEAILFAHFNRQLQQSSIPTFLPKDIESRLLQTATTILKKNGELLTQEASIILSSFCFLPFLL